MVKRKIEKLAAPGSLPRFTRDKPGPRLTVAFRARTISKDAKTANRLAKCEALDGPAAPIYFSLVMNYSWHDYRIRR